MDARVLICAEHSAALNGYSKQEAHGAPCLYSSAIGTASKDIFAAYNKKASLKRFSLS